MMRSNVFELLEAAELLLKSGELLPETAERLSVAIRNLSDTLDTEIRTRELLRELNK